MGYRQGAAWVGLVITLVGCASSSPDGPPIATQTKGSGSKEPAPGGAPGDTFAAEMRGMLDFGNEEQLAKPGDDPSDSRTRLKSPRLAREAADQGQSPGKTPAPAGTSPAESAAPIKQASAPVESAEEHRARLAAELSQSVRSNSPTGDPLREALNLLALDVIEPGISDHELAALEKTLSPIEVRAFDSLRGAMRELRGGGGDGGSPARALDAGEVARVFREHGAELDAGQTVTIPTMALCTSVKSYGRYSAFQSRTFSQGRSHQAILYVAVDHFSQRETGAEGTSNPRPEGVRNSKPGPVHTQGTTTPIRGLRAALAAAFDSESRPKPADQAEGVDFVLELEQTVELFHDSDNIVVWKVPAKVIRDVSHQPLRDCYLAQIIELPANLSTGKFNLKVTVRDMHTGGLAESILPLEIVADSPYAQANP